MAIKIKAKIKEKPVKEIFIDTDFIRLDSALKLADAVQSGGHAKIVIQGGEVKVNGEVCTMRGKKLRDGDTASVPFMNIVVKKR
ncbi:MAG: RNA-binding S4 domain-containing protein [Acutalibacteraceae bacterium]|jgi:ribosome-associated protein|nr:RNA-binding S4 domain-containing protein [Clostridia bacterium]MEE1285014.1 RNA-binding S4 domain-containing protein [Acutalibacteraceae bacterium]